MAGVKGAKNGYIGKRSAKRVWRVSEKKYLIYVDGKVMNRFSYDVFSISRQQVVFTKFYRYVIV
jgi:hypothetical protein